MFRYINDKGFESDSIAYSYGLVLTGTPHALTLDRILSNLHSPVMQHSYQYGDYPPFLMTETVNNAGINKLIETAYHEHILNLINKSSYCTFRARSAAFVDSYKTLKDNGIRFLCQYDDKVHGLSLVLFSQSLDYDIGLDINIFMDFVEHERARMLRRLA